MSAQRLSPEDIRLYHEQGYLVVKNFCNKKEIDKLYSTALQDQAMQKNALDLNDQSGKKTKLSLWFTPETTYSVISPVVKKWCIRCNSYWAVVPLFVHFHSQADAERTPCGRRLGMAPGLWVLV